MDATLFERHGGYPFMSRLVLDFYDRVLASERLNPYFARVDMRRLVDHQAKFIGSLAGGPAFISDETLAEIHQHLDIDSACFDEMVGLMGDSLVALGVAEEDRRSVIDQLGQRRRFVVKPQEA
jgi:hemoglobin